MQSRSKGGKEPKTKTKTKPRRKSETKREALRFGIIHTLEIINSGYRLGATLLSLCRLFFLFKATR